MPRIGNPVRMLPTKSAPTMRLQPRSTDALFLTCVLRVVRILRDGTAADEFPYSVIDATRSDSLGTDPREHGGSSRSPAGRRLRGRPANERCQNERHGSAARVVRHQRDSANIVVFGHEHAEVTAHISGLQRRNPSAGCDGSMSKTLFVFVRVLGRFQGKAMSRNPLPLPRFQKKWCSTS